MSSPFSEWLTDVSADEIVLSPTDINKEARGNHWSFSLSPQPAVDTQTADVVDFLKAVAAARSESLNAQNLFQGSVVLYCWHDLQASQLCLSLVSGRHGRLPFGCQIEEVEHPEPVVLSFLQSRYHSGIPLDEFVPCRETVEPVRAEETLAVWSVLLPFGSKRTT